MLYEIVHQFPNAMIFEEGGPLISLYQPTHRHFPENKQDTIVFKNLLREIENELKQHDEKEMINSIMKPFYELEHDRNFWNSTSDGIAILANRNKCIIYKLQIPTKEFTSVGNRFHIMPLVQAFQSMESYQLLGLSRTNFSLYQGNKYGFSEIVIDPDIPRTLEQVLGKELTDSYLTQGSFGGTGGPAIYHGQGDKKSEIDKDTEKYFRYVDRFVLDNYSKPSKMPLILVALKEYHAPFKKISDNPYLIEAGINTSYDSLELEQIKSKAMEIITPINLEIVQKLVKAYKVAEAESLGSSALSQVAKAAYESKIETILIEEDRMISGKIDFNNGNIASWDINDPKANDILDEIAEMVLRRGGSVMILPKDSMPSTTGIAAIYRYN